MLHHSYGIIPLQNRSGQWYALVILRTKGFWEFPKGHAEGEETPEAAARRELKEEIGLEVAEMLPYKPLQIQYPMVFEGKTVEKKATYFLALVEGETIVPQAGEVIEGLWLPLEEVVERLTYPNSKTLFQEVIRLLDDHHHHH